MDHAHHDGGNPRTVAYAIAAVIAAYVVALLFGWPQLGTKRIVEAATHHAATERDATDARRRPSSFDGRPAVVDGDSVRPVARRHCRAAAHSGDGALVGIESESLPRGAGAVGDRRWRTTRSCIGTAIEGHWPAHHVVEPTAGPVQIGFVRTILENAILQEFIPFIVLLFSLFTISGGIRITGDLQAHPLTNATFMAVGGVLASFIGTTGAAMLLIRPLLETNRERKHVAHTVVFFIFIVCNCGGCLLPIGDPPLFLGYLQGVPFLWTLAALEGMAVRQRAAAGDLFAARRALALSARETRPIFSRDVTQQRRLRISGWQVNVPLLVGVVLAVALLDPSKTVPGTDWHPWMYLREIVQLGLVAVSLWFGNQQVRAGEPVQLPARSSKWPRCSAASSSPCSRRCRFWACTATSWASARRPSSSGPPAACRACSTTRRPTSCFSKRPRRCRPKPVPPRWPALSETILIGISLGAVFMGAMTYIGNGPNFMVRAIAEKSGVKMPSFFGYMVYSVLILLPLFALMVWLFLM